MEDDGVSSAQGMDVENTKRASEELKGWSSRVEDLLDGGDVDGAVKLLKKVVESLQLSDDADTNLGLSAALMISGRFTPLKDYLSFPMSASHLHSSSSSVQAARLRRNLQSLGRVSLNYLWRPRAVTRVRKELDNPNPV